MEDGGLFPFGGEGGVVPLCVRAIIRGASVRALSGLFSPYAGQVGINPLFGHTREPYNV